MWSSYVPSRCVVPVPTNARSASAVTPTSFSLCPRPSPWRVVSVFRQATAQRDVKSRAFQLPSGSWWRRSQSSARSRAWSVGPVGLPRGRSPPMTPSGTPWVGPEEGPGPKGVTKSRSEKLSFGPRGDFPKGSPLRRLSVSMPSSNPAFSGSLGGTPGIFSTLRVSGGRVGSISGRVGGTAFASGRRCTMVGPSSLGARGSSRTITTKRARRIPRWTRAETAQKGVALSHSSLSARFCPRRDAARWKGGSKTSDVSRAMETSRVYGRAKPFSLRRHPPAARRAGQGGRERNERQPSVADAPGEAAQVVASEVRAALAEGRGRSPASGEEPVEDEHGVRDRQRAAVVCVRGVVAGKEDQVHEEMAEGLQGVGDVDGAVPVRVAALEEDTAAHEPGISTGFGVDPQVVAPDPDLADRAAKDELAAVVGLQARVLDGDAAELRRGLVEAVEDR